MPLPERDARVGSSEDNDICLPFEGVSRRHAIFTCRRGVPELVDDGSKNGVVVRGVRVPSVLLEPGVSVRIGCATVTVEESDTGDLLPAFPVERAALLAKRTLPLSECEEPAAGKALDGVVRSSAQMQLVVAQALAFARSSRPVLILGETGCGKEVVARIVHANGPRAAGPFIAVNCAAIDPNLIASELFGVESGVATNVSARRGYFAEADGGTLLLDEIGEISEHQQAALLRAVEEHAIWPVGARQPRRVRTHVLFATNRLRTAEESSVRADLLFRCKRIVIPPLRERREDVEPLARLFIEAVCREQRLPQVAISRTAVALLRQHDWPGNVRELRDVLEDAVLLHGGGGMLHAEHIESVMTSKQPCSRPASSLRDRHDALTRDMIESALHAAGGNKSEAARRLGMSRNGLRKAVDRFRAGSTPPHARTTDKRSP